MRAMILERQQQRLKPATLPDPEPGPGQLLLEVHACGVCRTDLHLRDAELPATRLPIVLGHQIVATTADRLPRRRPLARLDGRHLPVLHVGA